MKINNLTPFKAITWAIVLLILIFIILIVYRKIKKSIQAAKDYQLVNASDSAIVSNALTYTQADYKAMADKLYLAMDGVGTNENSIYEVIGKLRTKSDWYALIKAFGVRSSSSWVNSFTGNLVQWLYDELDDEERKRVNDILAKFDVQI